MTPPDVQTAVVVTRLRVMKVDEYVDEWADLEVQQRPVPKPQKGQVLVRLSLRPVHPADLMAVAGRHIIRPPPFVPGSEGVGVVEALGEGASKFKEGQRVVCGAWSDGTWQQYIAEDENKLFAVPDKLDDKAAGQFLINPTTATGLIEQAGLDEGDWLVQSAAGSTVGRMVVQYAKHRMLHTVNLVRNEDHVQQLKDLGADEVIFFLGYPEDYDTGKFDVPEISKRVKGYTPGNEGVKAGFDAVGGRMTFAVEAAMRKWSNAYVYGMLGTDVATVGTVDMWLYSKTIKSFILQKYLAQGGHEAYRKRLEHVLKLLADGVLTVPTEGQVFKLDQVREAVSAAQKAAGGEKVFLKG